jgi:hypothetical protein
MHALLLGMTDPFLKIKLNDQTVKTRTLLNTLTPKVSALVDDSQRGRARDRP